MKRFVVGEDRQQITLLPDCLDDYIAADNPVRRVEVSVDKLDLTAPGFAGTVPAATGRPAYHPATLLKVYLCGYRNRVPSSRRLERGRQRNIELISLTGRLTPDFETLSNFRKDDGPAIQAACAQFVVLCRRLNLFSKAVVAIDGSKFKAVNNRDKNFTAEVEARLAQVEASIGRDLAALDRADREPSGVDEARTARLERMPDAMTIRRQTVEHPFGTLKAWMGATHFLTRILAKVRTKMSLQVLAYNMKRMIQIFGVGPLLTAIRA